MSMKKDYDELFKFVIIGDSGVGKSNLLLRFADDNFVDSFIATIGVDFRFRTITVDGKIIKVQIWDTAGQERFRSITHAYYRGADGIILCYSVTDRKTFENLDDNWIPNVDRYVNDENQCVRLIIGTKADLEDYREVQTEEGEILAHRHGYEFLETSAKNGTNVDTCFITLSKQLLAKQLQRKNNISPPKSRKHQNKTKKCCQ